MSNVSTGLKTSKMISETLAIEFQEAVKEDYGKDMSLEEATRILSDLVGYFDKLAEIHYKDLEDKKIEKKKL